MSSDSISDGLRKPYTYSIYNVCAFIFLLVETITVHESYIKCICQKNTTIEVTVTQLLETAAF